MYSPPPPPLQPPEQPDPFTASFSGETTPPPLQQVRLHTHYTVGTHVCMCVCSRLYGESLVKFLMLCVSQSLSKEDSNMFDPFEEAGKAGVSVSQAYMYTTSCTLHMYNILPVECVSSYKSTYMYMYMCYLSSSVGRALV